MLVLSSILNWLTGRGPLKYKSKFKMEDGLFPTNTVLDYNFLILDKKDKKVLNEILNGVELFYKKHDSYVTIRHIDNESIVIINPFLIKNNTLFLGIAENNLAIEFFIGKNGIGIDKFKEDLNFALHKQYNMGIDFVKSIKILKIKC